MQFLRQQVQFAAVERRGLAVRALGDVAWTTGLLRYEGWRLPARQPFVACSFVTQIWCRVDQRWKMEVCHSTKVEENMWLAAPRAPACVDPRAGTEPPTHVPA